MNDITSKQITLRTATASAELHCDKNTMEHIKQDTLPKGDPWGIARAAGMIAAKKTHALIPHCHPIAIEQLQIDFRITEAGVSIRAQAKSIGRTGIEMEALTAVSVAALTLYDLCKPLKGELSIQNVRLEEKTGGRSEHRRWATPGMRAAILVSSDSTAAGQREDKSGPIIRNMLESYGIDIVEHAVLADEPEQTTRKLTEWIENRIEFVLTTGGTGLGQRDRTVESVRALIEHEAPGIAEAMRRHGQDRTPLAMLSRGIAGIAKETLIITLPGSSSGARESLEAILPAVFHATHMIQNRGH